MNMTKNTMGNAGKRKTRKNGGKDISEILDGLKDQHSSSEIEERSIERERESNQYQPVIVKRTDETFRHADDVLEMAIHEGQSQLQRPELSLFMSSVAAGMIIGCTVLAVGVMASILGNVDGINKIFVALVYPLGFILCILSRTELFTEHTATAVYPLLDGSAKAQSVLKLWAIVIAGNLCGGLLIALMLATADGVIHASEGYLILAEHVLDYDYQVLFVSAILAGWLMATGAWTILSTHSTGSQILCIYIATFVIGVGGLHHSIAGSVELFVGLFTSEEIKLADIIPAIGVILAGNAVGGSIFVALLNYGHIRSLNT
jgi:formate/nitrite transporter FocA (FNT family)